MITSWFRDVVATRHDYARSWKDRTGGKVVGYLCTYVPEEIIYAGGILPVRLMGSHQPQDVSERHIPSMYCSFCRDVLAQGLLGRYDYLDGLVFANSCLHIRQVFEVWQWQLRPSFSHYLYMPDALDSPGVVECWEAELQKFKRSLEAWTGTTITADAMTRSIRTYNENRRLLKELYELRRGSPPLGGKEAMEIVLSSMLVDKQEHNLALRSRLQELKHSTPPSDDRPRLMLVGSENDDTEVVEAIESLGAVVVIDDHCTGSRYFWNEAAEVGDPVRVIAERYIARPRCPVKDGGERRRVG